MSSESLHEDRSVLRPEAIQVSERIGAHQHRWSRITSRAMVIGEPFADVSGLL